MPVILRGELNSTCFLGAAARGAAFIEAALGLADLRAVTAFFAALRLLIRDFFVIDMFFPQASDFEFISSCAIPCCMTVAKVGNESPRKVLPVFSMS